MANEMMPLRLCVAWLLFAIAGGAAVGLLGTFIIHLLGALR